MHSLFEAQVERSPAAVALEFAEQQLSYGELNARANQLGHYLRAAGVGPEVLVGLCVERSVAMIVAVLGILKAGGAFVPLNPLDPAERLSFMIGDAGLSLLVTEQALLGQLPELPALRTFCVDTEATRLAAQPSQNLAGGAGADNLAYVIYTSGSTGQPKGVLVQHRGVCNLALAQAQVFGVSAASRVLQFASISFDAVVSELFKSLLSGATLCLARAEALLPVEPLLQVLRQQSISMVTLPPSVLALLPAADLPALRTVISAGEACPAELVAKWSSAQRQLLNAYGPTEVTVCATSSAALEGQQSRPPIGRPLNNTEVYVLDGQLQPVPNGVVGELYVGGVGLARGYLQRAALTAERFLPHPFTSQPGSRLYRTGDLARYREDGQLEYRGRSDEQVKLRGFRIELGEIEAVLGQHPAVREVVVLAREDEPGQKRLVAYLLTAPETPADVMQWRAWLSQKLPDYMLPAAYVLLEEFPLTASGKVDRCALPAPDASRPAQGQAYLGPRDQLEQLLVDLWQAVLGLDQVGVADNFFAIGGDSIKGAILINQLQELLGEYVYVVAIFDAPTVAALADYLRQHYSHAVNRILKSRDLMVDDTWTIEARQQTTLAWSPLVEIQRGTGGHEQEAPALANIQPRGAGLPFFCIHPVGGNILCYKALSTHLGVEQPFYGLQARGLDQNQVPHTQIEDMAAYYIEAIRSVQPDGPYLLGGWSMGGVIAFEMAQQLEALGQRVSLLALMDAKLMMPVEDATPLNELSLLANFARDLGLPVDRLELSTDELAKLDSEELLSYTLQRAIEAGIVPQDFQLAQVQRLFEVFKINVQAMQSYRPKASSQRVTLLKAEERPAVETTDETMGWGELTSGEIEIHTVSGSHFTIVREPHVRNLAEQLADCIHRAALRSLASHS